jgi:hypothetical protein
MKTKTLIVAIAIGSISAQTPAARPSAQIPATPLYKLDDAFLQWQLPKDRAAYAAIDGKHIH